MGRIATFVHAQKGFPLALVLGTVENRFLALRWHLEKFPIPAGGLICEHNLETLRDHVAFFPRGKNSHPYEFQFYSETEKCKNTET